MDKHKAPDELRRRIIDSIGQQRQPAPADRIALIGQYLIGHWQSLSAAAVCGAAATLLATQLLVGGAGGDGLAQQVASSHTRSLLPDRLIDVASSDRHTVKPWFAGKLDFSPQVRDYAADGFVLAGGRLDYLNDRMVAALVYRRKLHVINVYSWPTTEANSAVSRQTRRGINMIEWVDGGMKYVAVSDIESRELNELARLMRVQRTD